MPSQFASIMEPDPAQASPDWLNHPLWVAGNVILALAVAVAGVVAMMHTHWATVAAWVVCALLGVGALMFRTALPPFFRSAAYPCCDREHGWLSSGALA